MSQHELKQPAARVSLFGSSQKPKQLSRPLHVLIIDSQAFTRKLLAQVIQQYGKYHIDTASSVKDGLRVYRSSPADIVFLDIELPDGCGHDLTQQIKKLNDKAYIAVVSGKNNVANVERAKNNKAADFIAKPFSRARVSQTIERYFSLSKANATS